MKTQKSIKLKTGEVIPAGLPVTFIQGEPSRVLVQGERPEPYRVRTTSAFKAPSLAKLELWDEEGICKSVAGHRVEPDGWDHVGTPSWLLALGVI